MLWFPCRGLPRGPNGNALCHWHFKNHWIYWIIWSKQQSSWHQRPGNLKLVIKRYQHLKLKTFKNRMHLQYLEVDKAQTCHQEEKSMDPKSLKICPEDNLTLNVCGSKKKEKAKKRKNGRKEAFKKVYSLKFFNRKKNFFKPILWGLHLDRYPYMY